MGIDWFTGEFYSWFLQIIGKKRWFSFFFFFSFSSFGQWHLCLYLICTTAQYDFTSWTPKRTGFEMTLFLSYIYYTPFYYIIFSCMRVHTPVCAHVYVFACMCVWQNGEIMIMIQEIGKAPTLWLKGQKWVLTGTDDGKQSRGREGVEKRMASVLSSLCLNWFFNVNYLLSSVHDCRSRLRLYKSFVGVDFWSWVSSAKSRWLAEWLAMMSKSGVVYTIYINSTGPSSEPCGTPNIKAEGEEEELSTTID